METKAREPNREPAAMDRSIAKERWVLVRQIERTMEGPMVLLGFVWLALLVVEFAWELKPWMETLVSVIWVLFIIDFALKFLIAPKKIQFLRRQWLTALSLVVPALRLLRIARLAAILRATRAIRGLRLFRLIASLNRGLKALRASMGRRGLGYVALLVLIVTFSGAAGMYAFERHEQPAMSTYGAALWWTAMMMTTVGSDAFPKTEEGRMLCLLLAAIAFAVWGYVTASLATFFVGRDAEDQRNKVAPAATDAELLAEVAKLRETVRELTARHAGDRRPTAGGAAQTADSP